MSFCPFRAYRVISTISPNHFYKNLTILRQKVGEECPTQKGIYIHNGKKMVVE